MSNETLWIVFVGFCWLFGAGLLMFVLGGLFKMNERAPRARRKS